MLFLIEFIGTFLLLSAVLAHTGKHPHSAAVIAVTLAAVLYWGGGHYNPAITLMYALGGVSKGSLERVLAQVAGAVAAFYWPRLL